MEFSIRGSSCVTRTFIVNPGSGSASSGRTLREIQKQFQNDFPDARFVETASREDISVQTRRALREGSDLIVAVGGDGTLHEVVNGYFENGSPIRTEARIAVAPYGTGCDYYRTVIHPRRSFPWEEIVRNHRVRKVDVGRVEFTDGRKDRYFVNMASFGLSARAVEIKHASNPDWVPRRLKYLVPTVRALVTHRTISAVIRAGEERFEARVISLHVCKGRYAGAGLPFGMASELDDGLFDVTLFDRHPHLIRKWKVPTLETQSAGRLRVELDGEYYGEGDVRIRIVPKAVNICFPSI